MARKDISPDLLGMAGPFSKIARTMASNWNVQVIPSGMACQTDGERIWVPFTADYLPPERRQLLHGHLDHELSHVIEERVHKEAGRESPIQALTRVKALPGRASRIIALLMNAFEDVRIEAKYSVQYPGMGENLAAKNADLLRLYRARTEGHVQRTPFWMELTVGIIARAIGQPVDWLRADVQPYLDLIADELDEVKRARWSEDTEGLARRVFDKVSDAAAKAKEPPPPPPEDETPPESEPGPESADEEPEPESGDEPDEDSDEEAPEGEEAPEPDDGPSAGEDAEDEAPGSSEEPEAEPASDPGGDSPDGDESGDDVDGGTEDEEDEGSPFSGDYGLEDREDKEHPEPEEGEGEPASEDAESGTEEGPDGPEGGEEGEDAKTDPSAGSEPAADESGEPEEGEPEEGEGEPSSDGASVTEESETSSDVSDDTSSSDESDGGAEGDGGEGEATDGAEGGTEGADGEAGDPGTSSADEGEGTPGASGSPDEDVPDISDGAEDDLRAGADDVLKDDVDTDDLFSMAREEMERAVRDDVERHDRYVPNPGAQRLDRFEPVELERHIGERPEIAQRRALDNYNRAYDDVSPQIGALRGRQQTLLQTQTRRRILPGLDAGRLDETVLSSVRVGDRNVFTDMTRRMAIDTAIEVLVDLSGSMGLGDGFDLTTILGRAHRGEVHYSCAYYAKRTTIALAESWEAIHVPYEIIGFYNYMGDSHKYPRVAGTVGRAPFRYPIFKGWNERLSSCRERFVAMRGYDQNADGEAVMAAARRLAPRKESRRILVVISDGAPAHPGIDCSVLNKHLTEVVKTITKAGIEVWGIGAGTDAPRRFYNERTGARNIIIKDLKTLAPTLFAALGQRLLVKALP